MIVDMLREALAFKAALQKRIGDRTRGTYADWSAEYASNDRLIIGLARVLVDRVDRGRLTVMIDESVPALTDEARAEMGLDPA